MKNNRSFKVVPITIRPDHKHKDRKGEDLMTKLCMGNGLGWQLVIELEFDHLGHCYPHPFPRELVDFLEHMTSIMLSPDLKRDLPAMEEWLDLFGGDVRKKDLRMLDMDAFFRATGNASTTRTVADIALQSLGMLFPHGPNDMQLEGRTGRSFNAQGPEFKNHKVSLMRALYAGAVCHFANFCLATAPDFSIINLVLGLNEEEFVRYLWTVLESTVTNVALKKNVDPKFLFKSRDNLSAKQLYARLLRDLALFKVRNFELRTSPEHLGKLEVLKDIFFRFPSITHGGPRFVQSARILTFDCRDLTARILPKAAEVVFRRFNAEKKPMFTLGYLESRLRSLNTFLPVGISTKETGWYRRHLYCDPELQQEIWDPSTPETEDLVSPGVRTRENMCTETTLLFPEFSSKVIKSAFSHQHVMETRLKIFEAVRVSGIWMKATPLDDQYDLEMSAYVRDRLDEFKDQKAEIETQMAAMQDKLNVVNLSINTLEAATTVSSRFGPERSGPVTSAMDSLRSLKRKVGDIDPSPAPGAKRTRKNKPGKTTRVRRAIARQAALLDGVTPMDSTPWPLPPALVVGPAVSTVTPMIVSAAPPLPALMSPPPRTSTPLPTPSPTVASLTVDLRGMGCVTPKTAAPPAAAGVKPATITSRPQSSDVPMEVEVGKEAPKEVVKPTSSAVDKKPSPKKEKKSSPTKEKKASKEKKSSTSAEKKTSSTTSGGKGQSRTKASKSKKQEKAPKAPSPAPRTSSQKRLATRDLRMKIGKKVDEPVDAVDLNASGTLF